MILLVKPAIALTLISALFGCHQIILLIPAPNHLDISESCFLETLADFVEGIGVSGVGVDEHIEGEESAPCFGTVRVESMIKSRISSTPP